jgi:poly-gamma-glutamate capsule biosynthesis protein CapA/YwtB (metallophosphatase superfamily)
MPSLQVSVACVVALLAAACTASPPAASPPPPEVTREAVPTPAAIPTPAPSPTRAPPDVEQVPLVIATHLTRAPLAVTERQARRLVRDGLAGWQPGREAGPSRLVVAPDLPVPPGADLAPTARRAIAAVRAGPGTLALVPGWAMDPTVQAVTVDGIDPMRDPATYPLQVPGRPPTAVVTIAIGGDVMMDRRVGEYLAATGDYAAPFRPTAERLAEADITLVNLESTLARLGPPTQGIESFAADPRARRGLRLAGVDVVSLANNHSGDFGPASLLRTIDLLRAGGFTVVGAGADRAVAERPAVVRRNGVSVGFVGFNAIGETPPAGPDQPGANALAMPPRTGPLDTRRLARLTRQVADLSERVDVVVVVPHWGDQYTARPVAAQTEVGRALLAAGADIVVGGHPHWVQSIERVQDRLLVHSLGNLVFDMTFMPETQEGVVAEIVVWDDRVVAVDLVPYVISSTTWAPEWVDPTGRGAGILQRIWRASEQPFASPR